MLGSPSALLACIHLQRGLYVGREVKVAPQTTVGYKLIRQADKIFSSFIIYSSFSVSGLFNASFGYQLTRNQSNCFVIKLMHCRGDVFDCSHTVMTKLGPSLCIILPSSFVSSAGFQQPAGCVSALLVCFLNFIFFMFWIICQKTSPTCER